MTALLARARSVSRLVWAVVLTGGSLVLVILGAVFLRKRAAARVYDAIDETISKAWRARDLAQDRAVVEIAAARATERAEQDALQAILEDPDEDRRNQRLIEAARRLRDR